MRIYFFENPPGFFHFLTLPLEIPDKAKLKPRIFYKIVLEPLKNPRPSKLPAPLPPPFLRRESKFCLPPSDGGRESEKLKKEWKYIVQWQVFLGGWHFFYLTFSRFIIFTLRQNCVMHLKIFCYRKKVHSKLCKNEAENIP